MEYSALRLETLALHVVLRAGLATDAVNPTAEMEVAAWKQLKSTFSLVTVELEVETTKGVEATDDQWEFGLTSLRSEVPETQKGLCGRARYLFITPRLVTRLDTLCRDDHLRRT